MNKQQKLEAIYEAMADKTLSEGCLCWLGDDCLYRVCGSDEISSSQDSHALYRYSDDEHYCVTTIIGHPVRIGDVLEYWDFEGTEYALLERWKNKRLPIDDQSEETISYVFDLIK